MSSLISGTLLLEGLRSVPLCTCCIFPSPPPHIVSVDSLRLDATFDLPLKYPHQFLPQCSRTMRHFFITFPLSPPFVAFINPCRMTTTQCCRLCDRCLPTEKHLERRTCPKPWGLSSSAVVSVVLIVQGGPMQGISYMSLKQ